ncbi:hypothetical protein IOLA_274 [uncultured bacterium]|nr:hypothetical protein IOLA_274 [uncultured bacterium]
MNYKLLLVQDTYFKKSYQFELNFKKLLIFESLYGNLMIFFQKYTKFKLRSLLFIFASLLFIFAIFCYLIMSICYQFLNQNTYITNINKVDNYNKLKKRRVYISVDEDKNKTNPKIEYREKKNMADISKKQLFNSLKVINIMNNNDKIQNLLNTEQVSLPLYNPSLTTKIFVYMTILPIVLMKNFIYIVSKI